MKLRQRVRKNSKPSVAELEAASIRFVDGSYLINPMFARKIFRAKKKDVVRIDKHWLGSGSTVLLIIKDYDYCR